jgi:RNA polymerase sigma-70 factor (ECF subfamily)
MVDRARFEAYFEEHLGRVTRACALVLADPVAAEDVAAEAFTRLWANWDRIAGDDHAGGYVFKTAMRLCGRRRRVGSIVHTGSADRPAADHAERTSVRLDVFGALAGLPLRQRQALVLRDWAGFSVADVARMLGVRESTVRVHLARARQALRDHLTIEEREP